jgi:hypothetical protein
MPHLLRDDGASSTPGSPEPPDCLRPPPPAAGWTARRAVCSLFALHGQGPRTISLSVEGSRPLCPKNWPTFPPTTESSGSLRKADSSRKTADSERSADFLTPPFHALLAQARFGLPPNNPLEADLHNPFVPVRLMNCIALASFVHTSHPLTLVGYHPRPRSNRGSWPEMVPPDQSVEPTRQGRQGPVVFPKNCLTGD